jgi:hypothetical protein
MWYVRNRDGALELVHNRATAEQLAKEYGTEYMDGYARRVFKVGASV